MQIKRKYLSVWCLNFFLQPWEHDRLSEITVIQIVCKPFFLTTCGRMLFPPVACGLEIHITGTWDILLLTTAGTVNQKAAHAYMKVQCRPFTTNHHLSDMCSRSYTLPKSHFCISTQVLQPSKGHCPIHNWPAQLFMGLMLLINTGCVCACELASAHFAAL